MLGTGPILISVKALKGQLINWGILYPLTPAQAPAIPADRPSVGCVEWQVPANRQAAYMLMVQMPRRNGTALAEHRLERSVSQKVQSTGWQTSSPAGDNSRASCPQHTMLTDLAFYCEFIRFE